MNGLFQVLRKQSFASTGIYLLIFALCLAISATTALKFSHQKIQDAVTRQAAKMQAADLVLTDQNPLDQKWRSLATELELEQSEVTMFGSMAHTNDQFVMVNVKAIQPNFPLRGELQLAQQTGPMQSGEVWLSPRAMDLLQVKLSDNIEIADATFKVTGRIEQDSNQELGFSAFSPTVIISQQDVAKTKAIQVGSRAEYRLLMAGAPEQVTAFRKAFNKDKKALAAQQAASIQAENSLSVDGQATARSSVDSQAATAQTTAAQQADNESAATANTLKLRTAEQANSRLIKPIENLETFLQLANILTILLCGIAIALSSQRYVQQSQDHIALIRCMGATRRQIFSAFAWLLLQVIAVATLLGSLFGLGLAYLLLQLMLQLIPQLELTFSLWDMLMGPLPIAIFTSVVVLLGFVLPSLWELLNTAPIRVLRQQQKSAKSWWVMFSAGILSLIIFSLVLTENLTLTTLVIGSLLLVSGLLYLLIWLVLNRIKAMKNRFSSYIGMPTQSALQITALALGLSLITVLAVLRTDLLARWQQQLPEKTPNQFVYGLPPFELDAFKQQLAAQHWQGTALYPNIRGRLIEKNAKPFSAEMIRDNNALKRELNLTQTREYPEDNLIVAGAASLNQPGEVSVEAKLAAELGIQLGDQLTFSLPEGPLTAKVVSFRQVEWQSFSPNFFFIFSPETLDENAGSYLGSFYVPEAEKPKLIHLIQQFSNTVFVDVSLILEEVKRLVNVLVQVITVLAVLVSLSGFLVLLACINLLMDARKREVALMRSFGAAKGQLKNRLSLEVGLMGFFAGIMACLFAELISAIMAYRMHLEVQLHWPVWVILPLLMTLLCGLIGRYRLSYLCDLPPLQSLRELNQ